MEGKAGSGARALYYRVDGPEQGTPVLLINSLGSTLDLWEEQVRGWSPTLRVIRYDLRGHGRSATPPGEYSLDDLGHDAVRVLDAVGVASAHVCGISIGGVTALWLGIHRPDRLRSLVIANSAARIGTEQRWNERISLVRGQGLAPVADMVMKTWFTPPFREAHGEVAASFRRMVTGANPDGYVGCCAALRDADLRDAIARIHVRTLVVAGRHDPTTTVADAEFIRNGVTGARLLTLDAAHLSNVEAAETFSREVGAWFTPSGEAMRRHILGDAHVERATAAATPLNAEFQQFITRNVWGEIWTRPGLDARTRRVLVIGTMVALGRWEEFALHVRAAVEQGGFTVDDVREIVMQQAVYCGVPAANHALKIAGEVLTALRDRPTPQSSS